MSAMSRSGLTTPLSHRRVATISASAHRAPEPDSRVSCMDEPRASPSPKQSHTSITTSSAQMNPMRMTLFDEYHKSRSPFNCFLSNRKGAVSKDGAQSRAYLFTLESCRNDHRLLESGSFCLRGTNQLPRALHNIYVTTSPIRRPCSTICQFSPLATYCDNSLAISAMTDSELEVTSGSCRSVLPEASVVQPPTQTRLQWARKSSRGCVSASTRRRCGQTYSRSAIRA